MDIYEHLSSIKNIINKLYVEKEHKERELDELHQEYNYIKESLEQLKATNFKITRELETLHRENERLKENEKEMLNVSSIITTTNENVKLKDRIRILEKTIESLKNSKVTDEELMLIKFKGNTYVVDSKSIVYDYVDDTKGKQIGKRILNKKTNKYKIVFD